MPIKFAWRLATTGSRLPAEPSGPGAGGLSTRMRTDRTMTPSPKADFQGGGAMDHKARRKVPRFLFGVGAQASGLGRINRRLLYRSGYGLRILTLHETRGAAQMERLRHLVEYCEQEFDFATPEDIAALCAGRFVPRGRDHLAFTFDDGHGDNFEAARYLATKGIRAYFFVIPAFLDRTVNEYYEFHDRNGVEPFPFASHHATSQGLTRAHIKEMAAMGHVIGGHNYAHRNLGELRSAEDLEYEIRRSLEELSEILKQPCQDFAFGFGLPQHLSTEAFRYLDASCARLYSSVRGLNVPGQTPRILLREPANLWYPFAFTKSVLHGSLDLRAVRHWRALERLGGCLPNSAGPS